MGPVLDGCVGSIRVLVEAGVDRLGIDHDDANNASGVANKIATSSCLVVDIWVFLLNLESNSWWIENKAKFSLS